MGNKPRGTTTVKFKGKNLNLVLDINAMCELEGEAGKPLPEILSSFEDPDSVRITDLRLVAWAMMLASDPEATVSDAGDLMMELGTDFGAIIFKAVELAFPDAPGESGKGKK